MTITTQQVIETLTEIVAEDPERRAECFYSVEAFEGLGYEHTTPMCGVGVWVYRVLGEDVFRKLGENSSLDSSTHLNWLFDGGYIELAQDTDMYLLHEHGVEDGGIDVLSNFQCQQDLGLTWQEALEGSIPVGLGS